MEFIALIVFLWLIGCLFPGGGHSYGPDFGAVIAFILSAALIIAFFMGITALSISIAEWSGIGWLGAVSWLALFFGTLVINKLVVEFLVHRAKPAQGDGGKG